MPGSPSLPAAELQRVTSEMLFWRTRGLTHPQLGDSALPLSLPLLVPGRRAWVQHPCPAAGRV